MVTSKPEYLEFPSKNDFLQWKEKLEEETSSSYILQTKTKDDKYRYYECCRSGNYVPKGKGERRLKSQKSAKIGKKCPSRIRLKTLESKCFVTFFKEHKGHDTDLEHLRLPKTFRATVAGKLKEGIPMKRIVDDVRNKTIVEKNFGRISLISTKDIHNVKRDFDVQNHRHKLDSVSVNLWVEEMANDPNNPVIYFKPQGVEDEAKILQKDDFVLIIMTPYQKELIKKFGEDRICVDGTHGLNPYDFILHSLLIVDDFGNGSPVAFCFSNKSHESLLSLYFSKIKQEVGEIKAKIFMSDDAPAYYKAWRNVMGEVPHQLLCSWHVTKNFMENLSKIKSQEKKKIVFKTVITVRDELSVENFYIMFNKMIADLLNDEETNEYGKYFMENYGNRPEMWAYCFRIRLGINTNMYLESLHKKIKYHYLEGKVVKRLDLAINALLQLVRDQIFERIIKIAKNVPSDKIKRILSSHKEGLLIPTSHVITATNQEWCVKSSKEENKTYEVKKIVKPQKSNCCHFKCEDCRICVHSFTCTCPDNVIRLNICKHIHAVAMLEFQTDHNESTFLESTCKKEEILATVQCLQQTETCQTNKTSITNKAYAFIEAFNKSSLTEEDSKKVHSYLDKLLTICTVSKSEDLTKITNRSLKRKIDIQQPLFSTKKKRTKQTALKNPTPNEAKVIKKALTSDCKPLNIHVGFDHTY